jgi:8-oxo-dGTP diphosphatase
VRCADGHVRWGIFGAAGVVFVVRSGEGVDPADPLVMVQRRSQWAHEGGTFSCAGGALDEGEAPLDGALREASEEVGSPNGEIRLIGTYVFAPAQDWTYTTSLVEVTEPFGESLNFETDLVGWVPASQVASLPLHAGFAAAWPHLLALLHPSADVSPEATHG